MAGGGTVGEQAGARSGEERGGTRKEVGRGDGGAPRRKDEKRGKNIRKRRERDEDDEKREKRSRLACSRF